MNAKVRLIVVVILATSVIIEFYELVGTITTTGWNSIPDWEKTVLLFGIVVEFCGAYLHFGFMKIERR